MSESHSLLGMQFAPSPAGALPTQTFIVLMAKLDLKRLQHAYDGE